MSRLLRFLNGDLVLSGAEVDRLFEEERLAMGGVPERDKPAAGQDPPHSPPSRDVRGLSGEPEDMANVSSEVSS